MFVWMLLPIPWKWPHLSLFSFHPRIACGSSQFGGQIVSGQMSTVFCSEWHLFRCFLNTAEHTTEEKTTINHMSCMMVKVFVVSRKQGKPNYPLPLYNNQSTCHCFWFVHPSILLSTGAASSYFDLWSHQLYIWIQQWLQWKVLSCELINNKNNSNKKKNLSVFPWCSLTVSGNDCIQYPWKQKQKKTWQTAEDIGTKERLSSLFSTSPKTKSKESRHWDISQFKLNFVFWGAQKEV